MLWQEDGPRQSIGLADPFHIVPKDESSDSDLTIFEVMFTPMYLARMQPGVQSKGEGHFPLTIDKQPLSKSSAGL